MSQYQDPSGPPGYPPRMPGGEPPGKNMAIASMVIGIVGLVFSFFGYVAIVSIILAIIGLVLGVVAKKKNAEAGYPPGMATAGIVCSIIALVLSTIVFIACTACVVGLATLPY